MFDAGAEHAGQDDLAPRALPAELSYARLQPRQVPKCPLGLLRTARISAAIAFALVLIGLLPLGGVFVIASLGALLVAIIAAPCMIAGGIRNYRSRAAGHEGVSWRKYFVQFALAAAVAFSTMWLFGKLSQASRGVTWTIVSRGNLMGIARECEIYARNHGRCPACLWDLVAGGQCTNMQLVTFRDPRAMSRAVGYRSYVYHDAPCQSGNNSSLIMLYEREPWSQLTFRAFPQLGHAVYFLDGTNRVLSREELQSALQIDAQRRGELDLPQRSERP